MTRSIALLSLAVCLFAVTQDASAQTTEFTYQGSLNVSGSAANNSYDFEFALFDAVSAGAQVGVTLNRNAVSVTNGIFAVSLDFGGQFPGAARFLEIHVRPTGVGGFTTLTPRQPIASGPYSMRSLNAGTAANFTGPLAGDVTGTQSATVIANNAVTDAKINDVAGSKLTGTIPVAAVPPGSGNYIQNQNAGAQTASNFNISGSGTAGGTFSGNIVNAAAQFNINGQRVLSAASNNLFAGITAGQNTTTGTGNSFFGSGAGLANQGGSSNTAFGFVAGSNNASGNNNAFFGYGSGINTTSSNNAFFGNGSGGSNTTGFGNTYLGASAAGSPAISNATAVGQNATVEASNSLVLGSINGKNGATSNTNVGIGTTTPADRLHVNGVVRVDTLGASGDSALCRNGNNQIASCSASSVPSGNGNYIQNQNAGPQVTSNFNISGNGMAGGTLSGNIIDATTQFNVSGQRILSSAGSNNLFAGAQAGQNNAASDNSFFGSAAGISNQSGGGNSFFGVEAGRQNLSGTGNSFFGQIAGLNTTSSENAFFGLGSGSTNTTGGNNTYLGWNAKGSATINNATAVGWRASVESSNSLVLGSIKNKNGAGFSTNVGIGIANPVTSLHIATLTPKATVATTRAFSISTSDPYTSPGNAATPFTLDIRLTGAATLADRSAYIQTTELDNLDGGNILLQPATGKVGIGTTTPTETLSVNGTASKTGGGSWAVFSDERLKNIHGRFTPGLSAVMQLQPIRYQYKPGNALDLKTEQEYVGFSAQAVEKVIPEAITKTDTGYRLVNNDPIMWTMLNAIKEQQTQIEAQRRQIGTLAKANASLSERVREVESRLSKRQRPARAHR